MYAKATINISCREVHGMNTYLEQPKAEHVQHTQSSLANLTMRNQTDSQINAFTKLWLAVPR